ncbi:hypothetical protein Q1695_003828 [Nippostrongylus brasiliensis]|nr:hypothetical protein Q1695_003828 [Nippostrongylus brasiliensis]
MLKAFLGKYDTSTSTFVVPGLPPLEINAGRNGYFDGYIMSATGMDHMWLTPSYDNIAAIAAAAVVVPPRAGFSIQRGSLAIVRLQYKGNVKRWTRVIVENRQDAAHVQQHSIVPLQPTAIAIIAALMGSSSAILDKRLSSTRPRFGAGTSDISSIKGSSPRPGGVMITPVTSSERSNVSRSQSYQPSSDHVSKSQSSQRPEGEMITPVTTSERSSVSRSQSYLPSSDQSATSPSSGSSENSSSERSSDQGALGVAERSNSNPPTSVDNEYFESVTPDDVQRILMERAIIRQQ